MRQQEARWAEYGVEIAVVTFEAADIAAGYPDRVEIPWPVLIDNERTLYGAYGMGRAPRRAIWSVASLFAYARLLARGRRLQRSTADPRQRGGDVLIDPNQRVRLHHVGSGPADRPPVATLLYAVSRQPI